ncbi:MAG TPA: DUF1289 domain-containing protein [Alphaproteobacteria bacterium]|jgi:hypothetical protein
MSKHKVESPCVDVCKMDKSSGLCRGCLRTISEIATWKDLSRKRQEALLAELADRRARLNAEAFPEPCP